MKFTFGQLFFVVLCLVAALFLDFYLGARFGPEVFWGIDLEKGVHQSLLPDQAAQVELESLLKETALPALTFHQELENKFRVTFDPAKLDQVEVQVVVPEKVLPETPPPSPVPPKVIEHYTLQLGSFDSESAALTLQENFNKSGYSARLKAEEIPEKGRAYRVYLGNYTSAEEAEASLKRIQKNHGVVPIIVQL